MASKPKPPFRVEAVLPAPAHSYFLERDSAAFRSLLAKVLKIGQLECAGVWHEGASTFVKIITKPEFGSWVPKSVANQLQSSNLEFHDIIEYNPAQIASPPYTTFIRTESPFLKDKLDVRMTMTVEEVDGGATCRQVLEGHIRVKMFGVGRIIEGIVKESLHNTYKKLPEIVRRWQLFREEALRTGDSRQLLLGRPPVGCEVQWIRHEVLQILKEALPEDGAASPASPLCPGADASEASDDSPSVLQRTQRRIQRHLTAAAAAGGGEVGAEEAAAEVAIVGAVGAEEVGAEELELAASRRSISTGYSVYYDAREALEDETSSAAARRQQHQAAEEEAMPAAATPPWQQQQHVAEPRQQQQVVEVEEEEEAAVRPLPASVWPPRPEVLEAMPSPSPLSTVALAAGVLSRGARHRRAVSTDSTASTDTPLGEDGLPAPKQPGSRRYWRRFNREYEEWDEYWDEVGVEQAEEEGDLESAGVVGRALHALEDLLRDSYYSTSILVALFLMRHGWLRVEPDANADPHDGHSRQHSRHNTPYTHVRSSSLSGLPEGMALGGRGSAAGKAAAARPPPPPPGPLDTEQQQSLARVAQEVYSRMISGSRAVANVPVRAVVAAGRGVGQASATLTSRVRPCVGGSGNEVDAGKSSRPESPSSSGEAGGDMLPPLPPSDTVARVQRLHHRKTMSLDAGTAAAAQQAATEAQQQQQQHDGQPTAPAPGVAPPDVSPVKELQRRPSNLAQMTAMASMQREESRVRAPSQLSCFPVCGRRSAVKD